MSKFAVCAVRDSAMDSFGRPIFAPTLNAAIRSFADEVRRGGDDNQLAKHPEDFELYHLAWFEDTTGTFIPLDGGRPIALGRGKDIGGL